MKQLTKKVKELAAAPVQYPDGLATCGLFLICLMCYWLMSPLYGTFNVPDQLMVNTDAPLSFIQVISSSFLGGFWHGDLSHIMKNWAVMIPAMLIVEKRLGPMSLILFYMVASMFGGWAQYHMTNGLGIGSSCVTFGIIPLATFLMTKGIARVIFMPILIVLMLEAAKWWVPDGVGHVAHAGGMLVGFVWALVISIMEPKTKEEK